MANSNDKLRQSVLVTQLNSDRSVGLIALAFGVLSLVHHLFLPMVNSEGYLTFVGALCLPSAPVEFFFFQKFHPALSLLYSPFAAIGFRGFLVAHILVGTASVYLMGRVVNNLGGPGGLAALSIACSPTFVTAALSGQSNAEAVFFPLLVLFLHTRGGRNVIFAGLIAGLAFWTRYELAPVLLAYGLYLALVERHLKALAAFVAFPAFYCLGMAVYHGDFFAVLTQQPNVSELVPGNTSYRMMPKGLSGIVAMAWGVTCAVPVWPLLFCVRWRFLNTLTRYLFVVLLLEGFLLVFIPSLGMLFEAMPSRHKLVLLPLSVLIVSTGCAGTSQNAVNQDDSPHGAGALWIRRAWIALLVVTLGFGGHVLNRGGKNHLRAGGNELMTNLADTPVRGTIYTNDQSLAMALHFADYPNTVRFIPQYDIVYEMGWLANKDNGQYKAIMDVLKEHLLWGATWVCELKTTKVSPDDRFILTGDDRLSVRLPKAFWEQFTQVAWISEDYTVRQPRVGVQYMLPPRPPEILDESILNAPCAL